MNLKNIRKKQDRRGERRSKRSLKEQLEEFSGVNEKERNICPECKKEEIKEIQFKIGGKNKKILTCKCGYRKIEVVD